MTEKVKKQITSTPILKRRASFFTNMESINAGMAIEIMDRITESPFHE